MFPKSPLATSILVQGKQNSARLSPLGALRLPIRSQKTTVLGHIDFANNVPLVRIQGPVWCTIYHDLPVVKGVNNPLCSSTNGKRTSMDFDVRNWWGQTVPRCSKFVCWDKMEPSFLARLVRPLCSLPFPASWFHPQLQYALSHPPLHRELHVASRLPHPQI